MRRKYVLAALIVITMIVVTAVANVNLSRDNADQKVKLQNNQTEIKKKNDQLNEAKEQQQEMLEQNDASKQQIQNLEKEKKDLQDQLQAKAEQKSRLAVAAQAAAAKVADYVAPTAHAAPAYAPSTVPGCGSNEYSQYIYAHESGCRLTVTNAEGCIGIGQACPASKLTAVCPSLDLACQDNFFTAYAVGRYGSWQGAYNFWLANHWW